MEYYATMMIGVRITDHQYPDWMGLPKDEDGDFDFHAFLRAEGEREHPMEWTEVDNSNECPYGEVIGFSVAGTGCEFESIEQVMDYEPASMIRNILDAERAWRDRYPGHQPGLFSFVYRC